jgi:hypothetical protein
VELSRQLNLYVAGDPRNRESIFSWEKTPESLIILSEKIIRNKFQNRLQRLLAQVKGHRYWSDQGRNQLLSDSVSNE